MSEFAFFPDKVFSEKPSVNLFHARLYAKYLTAMREVSLWQQRTDGQNQVYRFLWVRAFHDPICVRFDVFPDQTGQLIGKMTTRASGTDPGKLVYEHRIDLSADMVHSLTSDIETIKFWEELSTIPETITLDGADWVLEGLNDGQYAVRVEWSPGEGTFRNFCLALVGAVGISPEPIY